MNSTTNTVTNIAHPQFTVTNNANSWPFLATQSKIDHETEYDFFENDNNQSRPILAKLNREASEPAEKLDMLQPSKQKPPSTPTTTLADDESKKAGGGLIVLEQRWPPARMVDLTLVF